MSQTVNLFKNPSVETNTTGYYTLPGTTGVAPVTQLTSAGYAGAASARATWSTASTAVGGGMAVGHSTNTGVERVDVLASTQYTATVWVRPSKAKTLTLNALVFNTTPTQVGSTVTGTGVAVVANTWTQLTVTFTTGVGGVRLVLQVQDTDATRWSIGNTLDVDAVEVFAGTSTPAYSDPSLSQMWVWSGTAHQSTSTLYTPVVTLTPSVDMNPSPRIQVVVTDLPPAAVAINVTAVVEGRTFKVRGGVNLFASSSASVLDSAAPVGVVVSYRAELLDVTGASFGFTNPASTTITTASVFADTSQVIISQPLKPALAIRAYMRTETAGDVLRPNPGSVVYAEGATVGTRIGGQRQGVTGMNLTIVCQNSADADEFLSMFGGYTSDFPAVLCVRSAPPVRIPRILYVSCSEPHEVTDYSNTPYIMFQMSVDEVQPPSPGLLIPTLRRMDIDAAYPTRAARAAAYATRLARDTDYSLAGLAGP